MDLRAALDATADTVTVTGLTTSSKPSDSARKIVCGTFSEDWGVDVGAAAWTGVYVSTSSGAVMRAGVREGVIAGKNLDVSSSAMLGANMDRFIRTDTCNRVI